MVLTFEPGSAGIMLLAKAKNLTRTPVAGERWFSCVSFSYHLKQR